jgi:hypothetical protein
MSCEFTEQHVRGLCLLAGIEVLNLWQIDNQYWPDAYFEERKRSPWFLVKTRDGMVRMGWRKHVLSINWSDTPIHLIVTEDDVTKEEQLVHAYSYSKAVEYLHALAALMSTPSPAPTEKKE